MIWRRDFWLAADGRSPARATLRWFWVAMVACLAAGGAGLQIAGPPAHRARLAATPSDPEAHPAGPAAGPVAQPAEPPHGAVPPASHGSASHEAETHDPRPAGAPPTTEAHAADAAPPAAPRTPPARPAAQAPPATPPPPGQARIADPVDALQEPAPSLDGSILPRIGPDGRMPVQVYAAPFDAGDKRPRAAVLLAGIGMAEIEDRKSVV